MDYNLGSNEYVIFTEVGVVFEGRFKCSATEVILTNRNIVCEYGTFRKKQEVFPLSQIKYRKGQPQISITGERSDPWLTIYFERGTENLHFGKYILPGKARARIEEWIKAILKVLAGEEPVPDQGYKPAAVQTAIKTSARASGTGASYCSKCGTAIAPGALFCSNCGEKLSTQAAGFSAEQQARLLKCLEELLDAGVISNELYVEKQRFIQNH